MFKQVMVAVDGSPTANRGLKAAIGLASDQHASLTIVHVIDDTAGVSYVGDMGYIPANYVDTLLEDLRKSGRRVLEKAQATARDGGVEAKTALVETKGRTVADTIVSQARKLRADVIVLGTHGRRGLRRVLMGSDAEAVLREARVPVLLVRAPEGSRAAGSAQPRPRRAGKTAG
ncbi:MAG TPA: universal stress protein [Casimicrobiaceae bacterium]